MRVELLPGVRGSLKARTCRQRHVQGMCQRSCQGMCSEEQHLLYSWSLKRAGVSVCKRHVPRSLSSARLLVSHVVPDGGTERSQVTPDKRRWLDWVLFILRGAGNWMISSQIEVFSCPPVLWCEGQPLPALGRTLPINNLLWSCWVFSLLRARDAAAVTDLCSRALQFSYSWKCQEEALWRWQPQRSAGGKNSNRRNAVDNCSSVKHCCWKRVGFSWPSSPDHDHSCSTRKNGTEGHYPTARYGFFPFFPLWMFCLLLRSAWTDHASWTRIASALLEERVSFYLKKRKSSSLLPPSMETSDTCPEDFSMWTKLLDSCFFQLHLA